MNEQYIDGLLRCACSVLDFDVGEFWCSCVSEERNKPLLHFEQLYVSPGYEDAHNILIHPTNNKHPTNDTKHCFSPIICMGVGDGSQIVWANTHVSEGHLSLTPILFTFDP